jgi:signal transduction histidine kinase
MVRTIVRLHCGALQVHSTQGCGTTFTLYVPLVEPLAG